jgi:uncharacterized protein (UPF0335 family)
VINIEQIEGLNERVEELKNENREIEEELKYIFEGI